MRASRHTRIGLGAQVVVAAALLLFASAAAGATRFASPSGAGLSPCLQADPCPIMTAVNQAAAGDVVHLAPGNYATTNTLLGTVSGLTIEGEGTPGPLITYTPTNTSFPALLINQPNWTLRNIRLTGTATTPLLVNAIVGLGGLMDRVELRNLGTQQALVADGVTVRDSVIIASPTITTMAAILDGTVTGSTIVADNLPASRALQVNGDFFGDLNDDLIVRNTLLRGGNADVEVRADTSFRVANLDIDYSAFRSGGIVQTGPFFGNIHLTEGTNNVTADPLLVNLTGGADIHQLADSPTIDAGDPAAAATSTGDIDGQVRIIGAAPDIGADETLVAPTATMSPATDITTSGLTLNGVVNPSGNETTYHFAYGTSTLYGSTTPDVTIPTGFTGVAVSAPITGFAPGTIIHAKLVATNALGTTESADLMMTVATPPPPPPPPVDAPPVLSALTLRRTTFRVGPRPKGASLAVKSGTAFRVALSEAATVTFTIERRTIGRRVGTTCRAKTAANAKRPTCVRFVRAGTIRKALAAGVTTTTFSGKIGARKLPIGSYRVGAVAVDSAGQASARRRVAFRIVR